MKRKNILMSVFTMLFVFNGIYAFQVNAAVSQRNSEALTTGSTTLVNYTYGWYRGSAKSTDSHGYSEFYAKNTKAGGRRYQYVWLDSDIYPFASQTKYKDTAKVTRGVKRHYYTGFKDYN